MMSRLSALVRRQWNQGANLGANLAGSGEQGRGSTAGSGVSLSDCQDHAPVCAGAASGGNRPVLSPVSPGTGCAAAQPVMVWPAEACRVVRELKGEVAELAQENDRLRLALRVRDHPVEPVHGEATAHHVSESSDTEQESRQPGAVLESSLVARCELLRQFDQRLLPPLREIRHALNVLNVHNRTDPSGQGYLHMGIGACHELERGLRDILELRSACLDCIALRRDLFSMETVLDNLQASFAPSCHARSIDLLVRISPRVPRQMAGDPGRVEQILFYLLDNAVRHTRQGQVRVEVDTLTSTDPEQVRLSLAVHDTGRGIPAHLLEHLSECFAEGSGTKSQGCRGLGVGLVMVRKLVGLMDGQFRLESLEGAYTSAYCTIILERLPDEESC